MRRCELVWCFGNKLSFNVGTFDWRLPGFLGRQGSRIAWCSVQRETLYVEWGILGWFWKGLVANLPYQWAREVSLRHVGKACTLRRGHWTVRTIAPMILGGWSDSSSIDLFPVLCENSLSEWEPLPESTWWADGWPLCGLKRSCIDRDVEWNHRLGFPRGSNVCWRLWMTLGAKEMRYEMGRCPMVSKWKEINRWEMSWELPEGIRRWPVSW